MMNYIWPGMLILSFICAVFGGTLPELSSTIAGAGAKAAEIVLKVVAMLCLWGGVMEIASDSGLTKAVARLMRPILRLLYPGLRGDSPAFEYIGMNISANLLGLSNAATPLGLEAMRSLQRENIDKTRASAEMVVLVVMNSSAMSLIPTTAAMLRQQAGSASPMEIMPASVLNSACALIFAVTVAKIGNAISKRRARHD